MVTSGKDSGGTMTFWDALGQGPPVIVENHLGLVEEGFFPRWPDARQRQLGWEAGLWNVRSGAPWTCCAGNKGRVTKVAFSPDGRTVATVSSDQTVRLWNLKTRREVAVLRGHPGEPLAFSQTASGSPAARSTFGGRQVSRKLPLHKKRRRKENENENENVTHRASPPPSERGSPHAFTLHVPEPAS